MARRQPGIWQMRRVGGRPGRIDAGLVPWGDRVEQDRHFPCGEADLLQGHADTLHYSLFVHDDLLLQGPPQR